jgi:F0F1-type ATP synthase delta subunit
MLQTFLSPLSYEIVRFLGKHPDFFNGNSEARAKALENLRIPVQFKHYLESVEEGAFLSDLRVLVSYLNGGDLSLKKNALMLAALDFFTGPFASKLDMIFSDYYTLPEQDRRKVVEALIKSDTRLAESLRDLLLHRTYQELASEINSLAAKTADSSTVIVQSPREMEADLKKSIRKELLQKSPRSFPVFQVNRRLIGGMRVFTDGDVVDHSWLNRVLNFTSINNAK